MHTVESVTAQHLPDEVLALIFASLPDFESVLRGPASVNHHWRSVSRDNDVWMHFWGNNELGPLPNPATFVQQGLLPLFKEAIICSRGFLNGSMAVKDTKPVSDSGYIFQVQVDDQRDGMWVASRTINLLSRKNDSEMISIPTPHSGTTFRVHVRGDTLMAGTNETGSSLCIFDLNKLDEEPLCFPGGGHWGVQFDDNKIMCADRQGNVIVRSRSAPETVIRKWEGRHSSSTIFCMEYNDRYVCTGSEDKTAIVADIATGEELYTVDQHTKSVRCLQLRDELLMTGSWDTNLILHDLRLKKSTMNFFEGHTGNVLCCRFDSYKLVSSSVDHTVVMWDLRNARKAQSLNVSLNSVAGVDFDSRSIYCGTGEGTVVTVGI